ncbi:hsp70 nucleotide exchange factor fes1 [Coemansia sp. RSA 2559]|nr:hsp70 nucleotide exchange factor fes1 [Coemansia sp. RSA 2559]KAJ2858831.1 hsp70 nucleotide exchange factor fes1 [Coemansia erecta]
MDSLLKWAILNGATASEDAPATTQPREPPKKLDPAVIDAILGRPASEQMVECMDAVEHADTPLDAKEIALDDLEMLVENIDNACNLGPLNMWPRLIARYTDAEPAIRSGALWVSGTAVQHNPKSQKAFSANQGLQAALNVVVADPMVSVRTKAIYCVSSFIRGNVHGLTEFIANNGLSTLMRVLEEQAKDEIEASTALRQKSFFLLRSLIEEALDTETPEDLRPGMYLPNAVAELGFVDTTAALLSKILEENDPDAASVVFEQIVGFLVALGATDSGKKAIGDCKPLAGFLARAKSLFDQDTSELDKVMS